MLGHRSTPAFVFSSSDLGIKKKETQHDKHKHLAFGRPRKPLTSNLLCQIGNSIPQILKNISLTSSSSSSCSWKATALLMVSITTGSVSEKNARLCDTGSLSKVLMFVTGISTSASPFSSEFSCFDSSIGFLLPNSLWALAFNSFGWGVFCRTKAVCKKQIRKCL